MIITGSAMIERVMNRLKTAGIHKKDVNLVQEKRFIFNDGGRAEAGFPLNNAGDCFCRAVSIATELPYRKVWNRLAEIKFALTGKRTADSGIPTGDDLVENYMKELGFVHVGITHNHDYLTVEDLPNGRLIVNMEADAQSGTCSHAAAIINGIIHDVDPRGISNGKIYSFYFLRKQRSKSTNV